MKYILSRLLVIAAFTALFVKLAYIERGYFSIGLEYFLAIISVAGYYGLQTIKKNPHKGCNPVDSPILRHIKDFNQ